MLQFLEPRRIALYRSQCFPSQSAVIYQRQEPPRLGGGGVRHLAEKCDEKVANMASKIRSVPQGVCLVLISRRVCGTHIMQRTEQAWSNEQGVLSHHHKSGQAGGSRCENASPKKVKQRLVPKGYSESQ